MGEPLNTSSEKTNKSHNIPFKIQQRANNQKNINKSNNVYRLNIKIWQTDWIIDCLALAYKHYNDYRIVTQNYSMHDCSKLYTDKFIRLLHMF